MFAFAGAMTIAAACSKEEAVQPERVVQDNAADQHSKEVLNRINVFKGQIDRYKANPGLRDGSSMSVEDALWNVEALFNYTYSYPELIIDREMEYDTELYLPVNHRDSVLLTDLATFYDGMYTAVRTQFLNDTMTNKRLLLLDAESADPGDSQVKVTLHTLLGKTATPPFTDTLSPWPGPFTEGQWWYFGNGLGGWDSSSGDATDALTHWLKWYLIPDAPSGSIYTYADIKRRYTKDASPDTYLYGNGYCEYYEHNPNGLTDTDLILDYNEMNTHFFGEQSLATNLLRDGSNIPVTHKICGLRIDADSEEENSTYTQARHWTTVWYGERLTAIQGYGNERGSLEP